MVYLNGKQVEYTQDMSIKDFLESQGYNIARVAVELNEEILPKAQYENTILQQEDKLEVVHFVGGGQC